jgi:sugar/nucleoside kinase (ribokinase family)
MRGTRGLPATVAPPPPAVWPPGGAPSVAVVGAHILDVLGRPVEVIPPGQGSARLDEIRATAAGTAAGTAVDLARLGLRVRSFGAVGTDLLGDIVAAAMAGSGVDTGGVVRKRGAQTSATILPIRPDGSRPALHVPGASRLLELADIDLDAVAGCDALLLGGPDALSGLSAADLAALVAAAKRAGALVVIDVLHPGSPPSLERLAGALALADWFCPNADQLLALTGRAGRAGLAEAIADVLALGTRGVAVTLGAEGCLVTDDSGRSLLVPALNVPVVDTTGCGDGFNAGFLTGLLAGCSPADAGSLGVACGALVATGLGSDAGIESLGQVLAFLHGERADAAARISGRVAALAAGPKRQERRVKEHSA